MIRRHLPILTAAMLVAGAACADEVELPALPRPPVLVAGMNLAALEKLPPDMQKGMRARVLAFAAPWGFEPAQQTQAFVGMGIDNKSVWLLRYTGAPPAAPRGAKKATGPAAKKAAPHGKTAVFADAKGWYADLGPGERVRAPDEAALRLALDHARNPAGAATANDSRDVFARLDFTMDFDMAEPAPYVALAREAKLRTLRAAGDIEGGVLKVAARLEFADAPAGAAATASLKAFMEKLGKKLPPQTKGFFDAFAAIKYEFEGKTVRANAVFPLEAIAAANAL